MAARLMNGWNDYIRMLRVNDPTNEVRFMPILYRPARIDDIQAVSDVYWQSVLDVYEAHGFGYKRQVYPLNPYYAFALQEEPEGFFVAEDEAQGRRGHHQLGARAPLVSFPPFHPATIPGPGRRKGPAGQGP